MAQNKPNPQAMVVTGALLLGTVATVALVANFSETGFGLTWPAVIMAIGVGLIAFGYWELGVGLSGFFLIWLLSNLDVIPEFSKSWPFTLIWVLLMVVIGFLRARSRASGNAT